MGGINPYAYVQNNPINFIDPYGLEGFWSGVAGDFSTANGGNTGGLIIGGTGAATTAVGITSSGSAAAAATWAGAGMAGYEIGAIIGSVVNNVPSGNGQTVKDWWADAIWDHFNPPPTPKVSGPFPVPKQPEPPKKSAGSACP